MAENHLYAVPAIVAADKYFDVSRAELLRGLEKRKGHVEVTTEFTFVDDYRNTNTVLIRLNIHCRANLPESWSMALKMYTVRIDGIDHEPKFEDMQGVPASGWHRHVWSKKDQTADRQKIAIGDMDGVNGREQFLIRGFKLLGISVNKVDQENDELLFIEG